MADRSNGIDGGATTTLSPTGHPLTLTHQRQLSVQEQPRSEHHGSITVKPITAISGRPPPGGPQLIPAVSSGQTSPTKRIAS